MTKIEEFVLFHLARTGEPMNRFELEDLPNSPLERKTSFYRLRDMENDGLITSRIEPGAQHRTYRLV